MLSIRSFCFNDFAENTYILHDGNECLIIDPGCHSDNEYHTLKQFIETEKLSPAAIINTHTHIDHVLGVARLKKHYGIPFYIGEHDKETLLSVKLYAPVYGIQDYEEPEVDAFLKAGEMVELGDHRLEVLFVPGHSAGHIAFYDRSGGNLFAGDVLFQRSIGRTDLPGGDYDTLIGSIRDNIFTLPEEVVVYPGHGPKTTVGEEKTHNPFCGINAGRI